MKTDNTKPHQEADTKDKGKTPVIVNMLPAFAMFITVLISVFRCTSQTDIAKLSIYTLILTGVSSFYIRLNYEIVLSRRYAKTIIIIGYLGAICLLLLLPAPEEFSFWMLGGLAVAMLIDRKLGLLFNINLTFMLGILQNLRPEVLIQISIICLLMSFLSEALKNKATVIYAGIIILSCNLTLTFAVNNFIFDKVSHYNYLDSLFSILVVLMASFFISFLDQNVIKRDNSKLAGKFLSKQNEFIAVSSETITKAEDDSLTITDAEDSNLTITEAKNRNLTRKDTDEVDLEVIYNPNRKDKQSFTEASDQGMVITDEKVLDHAPYIQDTDYEILCSLENELLMKLKRYSESLYKHSLQIGELSAKAAKVIEADEMLARAGGLYHEIGRMNGKNYIEEGQRLADEYAFPKKLKDILREHNIKYDKPDSLEAVIVMLSDNVISTMEYIDSTGEQRFTPTKVIDNIFQMRLEKGTFDLSGISLIEYKKLKEFYQREINKTQKME